MKSSNKRKAGFFFVIMLLFSSFSSVIVPGEEMGLLQTEETAESAAADSELPGEEEKITVTEEKTQGMTDNTANENSAESEKEKISMQDPAETDNGQPEAEKQKEKTDDQKEGNTVIYAFSLASEGEGRIYTEEAKTLSQMLTVSIAEDGRMTVTDFDGTKMDVSNDGSERSLGAQTPDGLKSLSVRQEANQGILKMCIPENMTLYLSAGPESAFSSVCHISGGQEVYPLGRSCPYEKGLTIAHRVQNGDRLSVSFCKNTGESKAQNGLKRTVSLAMQQAVQPVHVTDYVPALKVYHIAEQNVWKPIDVKHSGNTLYYCVEHDQPFGYWSTGSGQKNSYTQMLDQFTWNDPSRVSTKTYAALSYILYYAPSVSGERAGLGKYQVTDQGGDGALWEQEYMAAQLAIWGVLQANPDGRNPNTSRNGSSIGINLYAVSTDARYTSMRNRAITLYEDAMAYAENGGTNGYEPKNTFSVTSGKTEMTEEYQNGIAYYASGTITVTETGTNQGQMDDPFVTVKTPGIMLTPEIFDRKNMADGYSFRVRVKKKEADAADVDGKISLTVTVTPAHQSVAKAMVLFDPIAKPDEQGNIQYPQALGMRRMVTNTAAKSVMLVLMPEKSRFVYVQKTTDSAYVGIVSGNANYTLAGAQFKVYMDSGCTKEAVDAVTGKPVILTANTAGRTNGIALQPGNYYLKESRRPWSEGRYTGYRSEPAAKRFTVSADTKDPILISFADIPLVTSANLIIVKSSETDGGGDLTGTEFTVDFYAAEKTDGSPDRTWVIRAEKENDGVFRAKLDEAHKVSGDPFYTAENGKTCLPLGIVKITESKAPDAGYGWDPVTYAYRLEDDQSEKGEVKLTGPSGENMKELFLEVFDPVPSVSTKALFAATGDNRIGITGEPALIMDTLTYTGLQPETSYLVRGILYGRAPGNTAWKKVEEKELSFSTGKADAGKHSASGKYSGLTFLIDPSAYGNWTFTVQTILTLKAEEHLELAKDQVIVHNADLTDPMETLYVPDSEIHKSVNRISNHIGELQTWKVTAKIPAGFGSAEKTGFEIGDKLDSRLDYAGGLTLGVEGENVEFTEMDYTSVVPEKDGGGTVTVWFTDAGIQKLSAYEGKTLFLTINTSINSSAVAAEKIPNSATLDIHADGFHQTWHTPEKPFVYTGEVNLFKTDGLDRPLSGVMFSLLIRNSSDTYQPVKEDPVTGELITPDMQRYTEEGLKEAKAVTDDEGKAVFRGLRDGRAYAVREVSTKEGYQLLSHEVSFAVENGLVNEGRAIHIRNSEVIRTLGTGGSGYTAVRITAFALFTAAVFLVLKSCISRRTGKKQREKQ